MKDGDGFMLDLLDVVGQIDCALAITTQRLQILEGELARFTRASRAGRVRPSNLLR